MPQPSALTTFSYGSHPTPATSGLERYPDTDPLTYNMGIGQHWGRMRPRHRRLTSHSDSGRPGEAGGGPVELGEATKFQGVVGAHKSEQG